MDHAWNPRKMTGLDLHILPVSHLNGAALARLTKRFLEDEGNRVQSNLVDLPGQLSDWTRAANGRSICLKMENARSLATSSAAVTSTPWPPAVTKYICVNSPSIALFVAPRCALGTRVVLDVLEAIRRGRHSGARLAFSHMFGSWECRCPNWIRRKAEPVARQEHRALS